MVLATSSSTTSTTTTPRTAPVRGALIEGSDGALYGTTQDGGAYGFAGIVYKISKDGTGFTKLTDFYDGNTPYDGVIEASDGSLYGTTYFGGANGGGVVFKLNTDGTGYVEIHSFGSGGTGYYPRAGLIEGSDGALYGTTYLGGTYGDGIVFRLNRDGTGFRVLHDFDLFGDWANGGYPYGGLIEAFDGGSFMERPTRVASMTTVSSLRSTRTAPTS